jgi:NADH-quinone oxidoreductase subunit K
MNAFENVWLSPLNTVLSALLFGLGLYCLLTQRKVIKQVIGLKIMLQGVTLALVHAGHLVSERPASIPGALRLAESMVISALIVEAVVIALALAMIVNVYRHYPSGDIDQLDRLQG